MRHDFIDGINEVQIPFVLFESFQVYKDLYRENIEHVLINNCKNFMITKNRNNNRKPMIISKLRPDTFDLINKCRRWELFDGNRNTEQVKDKIEKSLYQLRAGEVYNWNVLYLDRIVYECKIYINYDKYLNNTKQFRDIEKHQFFLLERDYYVIKIEELLK